MNFKYVQKNTSRRPWLLFGVLLGCAVLAFAMTGLGWGKPIVDELLLFGTLCGAVYVFITFIAPSYIYEVIEEEGTPFLLVSRAQGRRILLLAKLALSNLEKITPIRASDENKPVFDPAPMRCSSEMFAQTYTVLSFRTGTAAAHLRLTASDEFFAALEKAWKDTLARAPEKTDTDEEDDDPYHLAARPDPREEAPAAGESPAAPVEEAPAAGENTAFPVGEDTPKE